MKIKLRRSVVLPVLLFVYLCFMVYKGWPMYVAGVTSPWLYFGGTAVVIACILLLHFNLRAAEHRRDTRKTPTDKT